MWNPQLRGGAAPRLLNGTLVLLNAPSFAAPTVSNAKGPGDETNVVTLSRNPAPLDATPYPACSPSGLLALPLAYECSGRDNPRKRGTRPRKRERPESSKTAISRGISRSGRETDWAGVTVWGFPRLLPRPLPTAGHRARSDTPPHPRKGGRAGLSVCGPLRPSRHTPLRGRIGDVPMTAARLSHVGHFPPSRKAGRFPPRPPARRPKLRQESLGSKCVRSELTHYGSGRPPLIVAYRR